MLKYLLIIISLCSIAGCTSTHGDSTASTLSEAEAALSAGQTRSARAIADELCNDTTATMTATELCRLSIVYMGLSDIEETDINTALATRCYRRAMTLDPDSAIAYYEGLPLEESRHVDLMSKLEPMLSSDRNTNFIGEDDEDIEYTDDSPANQPEE